MEVEKSADREKENDWKDPEEHEEAVEVSSFTYELNEDPKVPGRLDMVSALSSSCWNHTFGKMNEDWLLLTLLGISMAWVSHLVDVGVDICNNSRIYLYRGLLSHPIIQYFGWIIIPICLMMFSTSFTKLCSPHAAGSGVPELKTIFKGVFLKDTLSLKTFLTKVIGLTATLGTGLPIGKEGPFVHISSMAAFLLMKATTAIKGIPQNKARNSEVLAAACAVGVATAFATPIGGVLFSIEVTAVHFAVRNYWRGFYAAVAASVMNRFIAVWFRDQVSLTALFRTSFQQEAPFAPQEVFAYALVGLVCGLTGALFVWLHRFYNVFKNNNSVLKWIADKHFMLFPVLVTFVYMSLTFPLGFGMFVAGELTSGQQVAEMFSNATFRSEDPTILDYKIIQHWKSQYTGVYINMLCFIIFSFFGTIASISLPVPAGLFIPVLKLGAGIGRLMGELMAHIFPYGFHFRIIEPVLPGSYSIVGAAAFAAATTHTVSSGVIAFELTGQVNYAIPIMVAVFIAYGVAQALQPSIFDSIITMKKLPYLPNIPSTSSKAYDIFVEDFMIRDVKFIWYGITYDQLKRILIDNRKMKVFPLVDSADSMILLGSAHRRELITLIEENIGHKKKIPYLNEWKFTAEKYLVEKLQLDDVREPGEVEISEHGSKENLDGDSDSSSSSPIIWMPSRSAKDQKKVRETRSTGSLNVDLELDSPPSAKIEKDSLLQKDLKDGKAEVGMEDDDEEVEGYQEKYDIGIGEFQLPKISVQDDSDSDKPPSRVPTPPRGPRPSLRDPEDLTMDFDASDLKDDILMDIPKFSDERRASRFSVTKVECSFPEAASSEEARKESPETDEKPSSPTYIDASESVAKKKGILKKTQSFVFEPNQPGFSLDPAYATIHGGETRGLKYSLSSILKAKSLLRMDSKSSHITFTGISRADLPIRHLVEKIKQLEMEWEMKEMKKTVDFTKCQINPAPHQLVERTNLLQVHSIFSLLSLHHSYVTAIGRLIGVVGITELRVVIEKIISGEYSKPGEDANNNLKRRFSFGFLSMR